MQNPVFKVLRVIHAWLGALLALLVLILAVTGTLLLWKQEFLLLTEPASRVVILPEPERLAVIAAAVEAQFENDEILAVMFASAEFGLTKVLMHDAHYAYLDAEGVIVDEWIQNERPEEWLFDLHHRLLLGDTGLTFVGFAAMVLIVLVIMGAISYWPFRRGWRLGVWPRNSGRAAMQAAHRNLGLLVLPVLLLSLFTGLILTFPLLVERTFLEPIKRAEGYGDEFAEQLDDIYGPGTGDWLMTMQRAQAVFPDGQIVSARVPNDYSPYRIIGIRQASEWNPNGLSMVYIDAREGYMDIRIDATALPGLEKAYNAIYPLHTGKTGSLFYKWILTMSGMLVASLAIFGLTAFIKQFSIGK
jgi:uncharacterized iron-regulated membrane protein